MINNRKRLAIDNMAAGFSGVTERKIEAEEVQIKKLHTKIGQLTVEQ